MLALKIFGLCVTLSIVNTLDLPPYFKKCRKSDPKLSDCVLENIRHNWQTFIKGDNKYHIQKMTPLNVPYMRIKIDENLYGNVTNGLMFGFDTTEFQSFRIDLDKREFETLTFFPLSGITGDYDVKGKLIGLVVTDTGPANVTIIDGLVSFYFKYDLVEKRGKQHIKITDCIVDSKKMKRIYFQIGFKRNKIIGDSLNQVFNDNWQEIVGQTVTSVTDALSGVMTAVLEDFFDRVPYDNFFA